MNVTHDVILAIPNVDNRTEVYAESTSDVLTAAVGLVNCTSKTQVYNLCSVLFQSRLLHWQQISISFPSELSGCFYNVTTQPTVTDTEEDITGRNLHTRGDV